MRITFRLLGTRLRGIRGFNRPDKVKSTLLRIITGLEQP